MRRIFAYVKPFWHKMTAGFCIKMVATGAELFLPMILAHIIDQVIPLGSWELIAQWGGLMLLCTFGALIGNTWSNRIATAVARDATQALRLDLFSAICSLSCRQIDEITIPALETRLTSDTYHVRKLIGFMQRLGVRSPMMLLGGIGMSLALDPVLTLVLVCTLVPILLIVISLSRHGVQLFLDAQQSADDLTRTVREDVNGIRVIKAMSRTQWEKERFDRNSTQAVHCKTKAANTMAANAPIIHLTLNLGLTAVVVLGAFRVDSGLTTSGNIVAFLSYFTMILNAVVTISRVFVIASQGTASGRRISQVMELPKQMPLSAPDHIDSPWHVQFENVSFSYEKVQDDLSHVSFALKRGQTMGIIGPTGCGKSTILNLLLRFYTADGGTIRLDGSDVRSIPPGELRSRFGVVFQNDVLMADTIGENIDFARALGAERLNMAARAAQADFIALRPEGMDAKLSARGSNLSGGQQQRLLIARALAARPEVLLLDDASSALDYQTDAALRDALRQDYGDTTTLIVAQRVSAIRHADLILVMDGGRVVGQGTHQELLEQCGDYREICQLQMGEEANG